jgi:hypothetical protein
LDEDTDIPEHFFNATTYEKFVLIGKSAKGRNRPKCLAFYEQLQSTSAFVEVCV